MTARFNRIITAVNDLLIKEDAFGLKTNKRWAPLRTDQQVESFRGWLQQQVDAHILKSVEAHRDVWLQQYIREAYEKGSGRAFDDAMKKYKYGQSEAFVGGRKAQFLADSFRRPASVERVKLLVSRAYNDLKGVTEVMSTQMQRVLVDGMIQGKSPRAVATELNDRVKKIGITRARTIARTETIRAHADGQLDAMENMGVKEVGVMVEWSTTGDDRVCPLCQPLDGVVLKLKEARGTLPRHPNCRCAWLPANIGESTVHQIRGREGIGQAFTKSARKEFGDKLAASTARRRSKWQGLGKRIAKNRPKAIVEAEKLAVKHAGVFDNHPSEVVRWMASEGWTVDEAASVLRARGVTEFPESSVKYYHKRWTKGKQAKLTTDQANELRALRGDGRGIPKPTPKPPTPKPKPKPKRIPEPKNIDDRLVSKGVQRVRSQASNPSKAQVDKLLKTYDKAMDDIYEKFPELRNVDMTLNKHNVFIEAKTDFTGGTMGDFMPGSNHIRISTRLPSKQQRVSLGQHNVGTDMASTIRHEHGHHVWYNQLHGVYKDEFIDLVDELSLLSHTAKPVVSKYAKTNVGEMWSESFAAYTHPEYAGGLPAKMDAYFHRLYGDSKDIVEKLAKEKVAKKAAQTVKAKAAEKAAQEATEKAFQDTLAKKKPGFHEVKHADVPQGELVSFRLKDGHEIRNVRVVGKTSQSFKVETDAAWGHTRTIRANDLLGDVRVIDKKPFKEVTKAKNQDKMKAFQKKMDKGDKSLVQSFQGADVGTSTKREYDAVEAALKRGDVNDPLVKKWDAMFDKSPGYDGTVYRGNRFDDALSKYHKERGLPDFEEYKASLKVGEVLEQPNATSWSKRSDIAAQFSSNEGVVFKINNPSKSLDISHLKSDMQHQAEVVINRDVKHKIVKIEQKLMETAPGDFYDVTLVHLEEVFDDVKKVVKKPKVTVEVPKPAKPLDIDLIGDKTPAPIKPSAEFTKANNKWVKKYDLGKSPDKLHDYTVLDSHSSIRNAKDFFDDWGANVKRKDNPFINGTMAHTNWERNFDAVKEWQSHAKFLDGFIERAPKYEGRVFRGMRLDKKKIDAIVTEGEIELKGLSSWSHTESVVDKGFAVGDDGWKFVADLDGKVTAADVSFGGEGEVLMGRAKAKIVNLDHKTKTMYVKVETTAKPLPYNDIMQAFDNNWLKIDRVAEHIGYVPTAARDQTLDAIKAHMKKTGKSVDEITKLFTKKDLDYFVEEGLM